MGNAADIVFLDDITDKERPAAGSMARKPAAFRLRVDTLLAIDRLAASLNIPKQNVIDSLVAKAAAQLTV